MATAQADETGDGEEEKQQVDGDEWLLHAVGPNHFATAYPNGVVSSGAFKGELFSVDIESMTTHDAIFGRWPRGTVLFRFLCKIARDLGYTVFLELENGNDAHANVRFQGKPGHSRARKLAGTVEVIFPTESSPFADDARTKG